jgi:hypothetical protein
MDDKLCLDGMNTRNIDVGEGEEPFFWFVQKHSEGVPMYGTLLQAQSVKFTNRLAAVMILVHLSRVGKFLRG